MELCLWFLDLFSGVGQRAKKRTFQKTKSEGPAAKRKSFNRTVEKSPKGGRDKGKTNGVSKSMKFKKSNSQPFTGGAKVRKGNAKHSAANGKSVGHKFKKGRKWLVGVL